MLDESETTLFTPAAILPGQIPGGQRLDGDTCGPRALMLAILEDAARCIVRARRRRHYRTRALAAEAEAWMRSDDRAYPFSFLNISDVLGIEADAIRARLLPDAPKTCPEGPGVCGDRVVTNGGVPPNRHSRSAAA